MKIFNIEIVYIIFYIFVEKSIATLTHKIQTYINIKKGDTFLHHPFYKLNY